jgi:hypothetical protein
MKTEAKGEGGSAAKTDTPRAGLKASVRELANKYFSEVPPKLPNLAINLCD